MSLFTPLMWEWIQWYHMPQRSNCEKPSSIPTAPRNDKPREPPPPATPVDFPRCRPHGQSYPWSNEDHDLVGTFTNIMRTGPSMRHLEAFNVSLMNEVPLQQLLPADYLPPTSWTRDPNTDENTNGVSPAPSTPQTLSHGAPVPSRKVFYDSVKELSYDNEDAFRAVRREPPPPNKKPAKVVYFRKFWDNLNFMADFWDTSLDQYTEQPDDRDESAMDVGELRSEAQQDDKDEETAKECGTKKKTTYTGRRTDTGRNMPSRFREDTVFAFVETLVLAFRCRLQHAQIAPKLKLHGMMMPLPHAGSVYRQPKDRERARNMIIEGPLFGVCCREQTSFRRPDEEVGQGKQEIMDLMRETGLVLMLAQKRAREGKLEEFPGQDKWWANAPRWGGGRGGDAGGVKGELVDETESTEGPRKRSKKAIKVDSWAAIRPPSSTWEKNVAYMRIGRDKKSDFDDIFLISSVNHHISILHARIPLKYIDYFDDCNSVGTRNATHQSWFELKLRRSRWFDLLNADDRVQAMRGIWAVLGYIMREDGATGNEDQLMEV